MRGRIKPHGAWKLCSLALLSGCGSAVSQDYLLPESTNEPPTFAHLRAQVSGYTDADRDRVRATLVWFPVLPAQHKVQTGQSLKVNQNKLHLLIGIPLAPPPQAVEQTGNTRAAYAELVLYEDRDNDNELDGDFFDGGQWSYFVQLFYQFHSKWDVTAGYLGGENDFTQWTAGVRYRF